MLKTKTLLKTKTYLRSKTSLKAKTPLKAKRNLQTNINFKSKNSKPHKKISKEDNNDILFAKHERFTNDLIVNECKKTHCEICHRETQGIPHHIVSRGAGGPDIPENLIQLCTICHTKAHNGEYTKDFLFGIISRRLKQNIDTLKLKIKTIMGRI